MPKNASDLYAKIVCRRSKHNPDKTEKVFGFQVIISTTIEPELGLEFPIYCITKPSSAKNGNYFIHIKEQIKWTHPSLHTYIDIGDSGFDETDNYNWSRAEGSIPIFDYNVRNEDLSQQALINRGYGHNGYPFAPCKATCHPNGYDKQDKRLSFVCTKQCLSYPQSIPNPIPDCQYITKPLGFSCHMGIADNPRLFSEIPRCSKRWK